MYWETGASSWQSRVWKVKGGVIYEITYITGGSENWV